LAWTKLLPSGKYQGLYRVPGNIVPLSAGTYSQPKQALRAATIEEDKHAKPGAIDPRDGRTTWRNWFHEWHDSRALAYSTDQTYRSTADCHLMDRWGDVRLCDIEALDVSRWAKEMANPTKAQRAKGKAPASVWVVRNALMLLKTSLNAAVVDKRIAASPAATVAYPDMPVGLERFLTPDEVEAITFYMDGPNALIVWTAVQTGLRFGELSGLHWSRLDLDRGMIQVVEKYDQKAYVIDPLPKDNEQRYVPLTAELVRMLTHWRDHAAPVRNKTCGVRHIAGRCTGDLVFRAARGAPLKSNDWGRWQFKHALKMAGIEDRVRPHDMRHTYASWLLQQGVTIAELALLMGHSDWETAKKYAHLSSQTFETARTALTDHVHSARRAAERAAEARHAALYDAMPGDELHVV
jgi:integrase